MSNKPLQTQPKQGPRAYHKKKYAVFFPMRNKHTLYTNTPTTVITNTNPNIFYFTSIIFGMVDDELEQVASPNHNKLLSWMELGFWCGIQTSPWRTDCLNLQSRLLSYSDIVMYDAACLWQVCLLSLLEANKLTCHIFKSFTCSSVQSTTTQYQNILQHLQHPNHAHFPSHIGSSLETVSRNEEELLYESELPQGQRSWDFHSWSWESVHRALCCWGQSPQFWYYILNPGASSQASSHDGPPCCGDSTPPLTLSVPRTPS